MLLRSGYDKTTMEDIAREAGVGKGTLYLHWNTREALFTALILREKVAMAEDIKQRLASDPAGATLRGLLKHAALALMQQPLLKAVLLRETEVFGKPVQREQSSATSVEVLAGFTVYLETLRDQGLVRTDLSLHALAALFSSIFIGFFLAVPLLPDAITPSDEELAESMAETGHRTLEPRGPLPSDGLQSVRPRGRKGGRAKKLKTAAQVAQARRLYADKTRSIQEICSTLGISRASFYRYLKDTRQEEM